MSDSNFRPFAVRRRTMRAPGWLVQAVSGVLPQALSGWQLRSDDRVLPGSEAAPESGAQMPSRNVWALARCMRPGRPPQQGKCPPGSIGK